MTIIHRCFHHREEKAKENSAQSTSICSYTIFVAKHLQHSLLLLVISFLENHSPWVILVFCSWLCVYKENAVRRQSVPSRANSLPLPLALL